MSTSISYTPILRFEEGLNSPNKDCDFRSTKMKTRIVTVCTLGAILTAEALWFVNWSKKQKLFIELWSNASQFLATRFFREAYGEEREEVDWANLPIDVCGVIGKSLPSHLDILRFRSVCNKWRSSFRYPSLFPISVPPPPIYDLNTPFYISEVDVYAISKYNRLHVVLEKVDNKFRPNFMLPCEVTYPKECCMDSPRKPFDELSFFTKVFRLRMGSDMRKNNFAYKTVFISSERDQGIINPNYVRVSDFSVVVHLTWGILKGRLALMRLAGGARVWDVDFHNQVFEDIDTYRGRLCALDGESGRVFVMDYDSLQMTQLGPPLSNIASNAGPKYLLELCGDLYVVDKTPLELLPVKVAYKLSLRDNKWRKIQRFNILDRLVNLKPSYV